MFLLYSSLSQHDCSKFYISFLLTIPSFSAFSFCMFVILTVLFLFLGASIVCVYKNLKRTADLVLWFLDKTFVCTHQNDLIVLTVPLNRTKLESHFLVNLEIISQESWFILLAVTVKTLFALQTFLRICCLRRFGYFLSGIDSIEFCYKPETAMFIGPSSDTSAAASSQDSMEKMVKLCPWPWSKW